MARRPESWHCVAQGECLLTIAHRHGVSDWATIYNHPENESLRGERSNPHVLYPGDLVYIPAGEIPSSSLRARQTHRFKGKIARTTVHVVLHDESGQPLAGVAYELEAQGERFDGTTNADGAVRERVDIRAREAQLQLFPDGRDHPARVVRFAIGHLDPPSTDSGIRGRLINLGYDRSEPDADAVRAFQRDAGLDAHGEVDVATLEKLRNAHRA